MPTAALVPAARSGPALVGGITDVPRVLAERIELANFLADANLLPGSLRKQPANLLLVMHRAMALDLPLSVAIEHMHVIDGQVGQSAELLRGLLHRAGHILRWGKVDENEANAELVLRHDPRHPRTERFTIADAKRMKLTAKDNWTKDPASMMVARVTTRLVSRHCPEIALAIGNLSAVDVEPEPAAAAPEPAGTGTATDAATDAATAISSAAAEALEHAQHARTMQELSAIGTQAREQGLLDATVVVDGSEMALQQALLQRVAVLRARTEPPAPPAPPAPPVNTDKASAKEAPAVKRAPEESQDQGQPKFVRPSQRSSTPGEDGAADGTAGSADGER
jgi:hypothetical protein